MSRNEDHVAVLRELQSAAERDMQREKAMGNLKNADYYADRMAALDYAIADSARLAYVIEHNWIATKLRCEHGIQDSDARSARAAIDAAMSTPPQANE